MWASPVLGSIPASKACNEAKARSCCLGPGLLT